MSSQSPRPPRRRIAGERRAARPDEAVVEATSDDEATTASAPTELEEDVPASPPPPAGPTAESSTAKYRGPSWPVIAVLGVLTLLLVAAAAVLGLGVWNFGEVRDQDQVDEASRAAPAAAERASAAILSYGYESLDADEAAAKRYMTPSYQKEYTRTFDKLVRPNAAKLKAKVEAEVKASGVAHADPDRVNVLLYVNQTTTSTANGGEPQLALNRVQLSMVRRGDSWLVNDITSY